MKNGRDEPPSDIAQSMRAVFASYRKLLESSKTREGALEQQGEKGVFWDVVVLTTFDEPQRQSFLRLLQQYKSGERLPAGTRIEVVADPENTKLGSGGSTLHCLQRLQRVLGQAQLQAARILIIHSGGSSKRLPTYSAQGKIFAPVPVEGLVAPDCVPLMLDVKLAMYLPLCRLLPPGVLVTCADDIETFHIPPHWPSQQELCSLQTSDVIALAHPSPVATGKGHGVYVLPQSAADKGSVSVQTVLEVLQKPSEETMRRSGAVLKKADGSEMVYTDSVFWLSERLYEPLLKWYTDNSPLKTELDAYAHFLPCFGERVQTNIEKNDALVAGAATLPTGVQDFRYQMSNILGKFSLKLIVLNHSKFYHLGSMKEYINLFTNVRSFQSEMNLSRNTVCNKVDPWMVTKSTGSTYKDKCSKCMIIGTYIKDDRCRPRVGAQQHVVVEWCHIATPITLANNVIVSNCIITENMSLRKSRGENLTLYENALYHTVPIRDDGSLFYVTVILDLDDDLKISTSDVSNLRHFGQTLTEVMTITKYKREEVLTDKNQQHSLWNIRVFPRGTTPCDSFWNSFNFVSRFMDEEVYDLAMRGDLPVDHEKLYSLQDVVELKDLDVLVEDRESLLQIIQSSIRETGTCS